MRAAARAGGFKQRALTGLVGGKFSVVFLCIWKVDHWEKIDEAQDVSTIVCSAVMHITHISRTCMPVLAFLALHVE